jgi:hypothetical protein
MIGILTPISPTILMMTRQFHRQASTWDHHPLHQRTPHQIFLLPTSSQRIISSRDRLFFISHAIGSGDICKWRLVRVAFEATMSLYSSCLVDGRYLVDFYIAVVGRLDIVPYICTCVQYDGTFGASDQGQTLDV